MHVWHPRRQGRSSHRVLGPRKGRDQLVPSLNAEMRAHPRGNLQNLSRKKVSRNTITYGHQREGPSALWKPAPIRTGKQASRKATAWAWREPSNHLLEKQWARSSWAPSGSKGKGSESHSAWMTFLPVEIADTQKQSRAAGVSFDQFA